jgi:hypothetical protein
MTDRGLGRRDLLRGAAFAVAGTTVGRPRESGSLTDPADGTQAASDATRAATRVPDDVLPTEILRHGAYLCLSVRGDARRAVAAAALPALAARLGLRNEFDPGFEGHPSEAIAFLRRVDAAPADIRDQHLLQADALIHVASRSAEPVTEFCTEAPRLLGPAVTVVVLRGVVRPPSYTGAAMHNFAYAHQIAQQPGPVMPNAFLIPMKKTEAWWAKDWMERHTYFLPRYDEGGRMVGQGHALASAAGIPCLMRRTYKNLTVPAPDDTYDFLTYFECADVDVPTFRQVCGALRDVSKNPEWTFVREGPTWHGRRVATWRELFA